MRVSIHKRLFMIFQRDLPIQVRYEFKLNKPELELSYMQIIPGPLHSATPIYRMKYTDYKYARFPNLISAARYVKLLKK